MTTPKNKTGEEHCTSPASCEHKLVRVPKGTYMTGDCAEDFAERVEHAYTVHRASIRLIAEVTARSYGTIHSILVSRNVPKRPRRVTPRHDGEQERGKR
ncbi:helix-turn-helix domain-containing protein [Streptomyces diacarni]|uniref:helix-turn-helix domain-containing protein n=1 Tax=Streptomyces diacarni TaxID=2800381 RepID=UPI0033E41A07